MRRAAFYIVILLALIFPSTNRLAAQDDNLWLYDVVDLEDSYELIRTDVMDGHSELILSVPKTIPISLFSIISASEIIAAYDWFEYAGDAYFIDDANDFLNGTVRIVVHSITPAPDNQTVAMNITYQVCTRGIYNTECFGISQIVLVPVTTGQQKMVWEVGLHAAEYLPWAINVHAVQIRNLRWLPDQQALIAELSDITISKYYYDNMSIMVIPLTSDVLPFWVGDGNDWTVAPDSREIAIVSSTAARGPFSELHRISFDPGTGKFTQMYVSEEPYIFSYDFGLAYLSNNIVLDIGFDTSIPYHETFTGALGLLTPEQPTALTIVRPEIGGYRKIQASTTGNVAVIQNADGLLWKVRIFDGVLWVAPLTESPVTFWQFIKDDILVYQLLGSTQYLIADLSPNIP